jgi:hypothetical protein
MDEDRKVRFLVAPMLFLASLIWGAVLTPDMLQRVEWLVDLLPSDDLAKIVGVVIGALATGGLIVFVAGYVIGTINYFCLRCFFSASRCLFDTQSRFHEAALSDPVLQQLAERLKARLKAPKGMTRDQELYAVVAFDHGRLFKTNKGVHKWLVRRWSAFSIATCSIAGLLISFAFGCALGNSWAWRWYVPVGGFAIVLVFVAIWAWQDTMQMLTFMISLPDAGAAPKDGGNGQTAGPAISDE